MMKPSRTRAERQQPQSQYLNEQELKEELHKQADFKRNEKRLQQLREKEEILSHYQNYKLSNQPDEGEFSEFLAAKKDSLSHEIQETFQKHPQMQDVHRQLTSAETKKEQERLQRLKLREEERLRRANGLASAYEGSKEPLPFQLERQLKENINNNGQQQGKQKVKEDLFTPLYQEPPPVHQQREPTYQQREPTYQQREPAYQPREPAYQPREPAFQPREPAYQPREPAHRDSYEHNIPQDDDRRLYLEASNLPPRRPSSQQPLPRTPMTSKQEQDLKERERQRQYKEELDKQINQKRNAEMQQNFKPYSQQSNRPSPVNDDFYSRFGQPNKPPSRQQSNAQPPVQKSPISEPKSQQSQRTVQSKNEYANELMDQIVNKNNQRSQVNTHVNNEYKQPQSYQEEVLTDQQRAQLQKQAYKQELDNQIHQKKMQANGSSQSQRRPSEQTTYQPTQHQQKQQLEYAPQYIPEPIESPARNIETQDSRTGFARRQPFHQDNDQTERQKQQKLKYAEDLRQQMEDRERKKKEAEKQQQENDRLEQERFYRALEEDKRQQERTKDAKEEVRHLPSQQKQQQPPQQKEVFEHQVGYKTAAQRRKEQNLNLLSEDYNPPPQQQAANRMNLFDEDPPQPVVQDNHLQFQHQQRSIESDHQSRQQQRPIEPELPQQNHFQQRPFEPEHQYQPQPLLPSHPTPQVHYPQQQQQHYSMQPAYPQMMSMQPQYATYSPQFMQVQPGMLFQQPQIAQGLFDQINQYQNVLFNSNPAMMQPMHMQIHQNYLMQLQQSKNEIEMVRHILEEKLRIQQLEMQNHLLIEQYKTKVRDIQSEQVMFEKEISKLKSFLLDRKQKEPLNPQVFTSALYMSILGQGSQVAKMAPAKQPTIQTLMPQHVRPRDEDVELPASSDYVPVEFENNSIWNGLQVNQNKSFMSDFQNIRGSQAVPEEDSINEKSRLDSVGEESQLVSPNEESHLDVDGFDVNMLRTQDYMDMFKQNIQSQPKPKLTHLLHQNSHHLEMNINTDQQSKVVASKVQQSSVTNAISQFQSKFEDPSIHHHHNNNNSGTYLAISASIPMSQLQKAQEMIMSDAKFVNDQNSIILPEDDIDEEKFNNFIESNEDQYIQKPEKLKFIVNFSNAGLNSPGTPIVKIANDPVPLLQKPSTAYNMPLAMPNYATGRSDGESISSKKYKKPKTFDVFSKLDQTSQSNMRLLRSPPHQEPPVTQHLETNPSQHSMQSHKSYKVTQLRQSIEIGKVLATEAALTETPKQSEKPGKSPEEQQSHINYPLPSNIYSNCTNLNPLTSQTTFIVDKRTENIMNRLDNFLSQVEQSQDQNQKEGSMLFQSKRHITTPLVEQRVVLSRKARDFTQAQRDDRAINKLDEMRESEESTPHEKPGGDEYSMMFKYDDVEPVK